MNRVQKVTQKHYRVEKPCRKVSQVHEHQNWPNWHPGTPRCAQAWSYRGRAWPCPGRGPRSYRSSRLPCRSAVLAPLRAMSRAPCPAPQHCVAGYPSAVSWPAWPYRRRKVARLACRVLGWLCCIATQPSLCSLGLSQYNWFCIAIQVSSQPKLHVAIHSSVLQYKAQSL